MRPWVEVWYLKAPHADTLISEYDVRGVRTGRVSEVASAQEVLEVSSLVGYVPRADLWKMCYNSARHDATSQTFHKQCDTLVGRCRCRLNPGGAG